MSGRLRGAVLVTLLAALVLSGCRVSRTGTAEPNAVSQQVDRTHRLDRRHFRMISISEQRSGHISGQEIPAVREPSGREHPRGPGASS